MPKFTIYVEQVITREGQITIEADSEDDAYEIQKEMLAEDFDLEQVDSVFTIQEIIEETI